MRFNISPANYSKLLNAIGSGLFQALRQPAQTEPQLVANMACYVPQFINALKLPDVHSAGVFVHGRPLVHCSNFPSPTPLSVEIGDLLLLRTIKNNGNVISRAALLLQAKKTNSLPFIPEHRNQYHLYSKWPSFQYTAPNSLKGKKRHIAGPDLYNAAKFLLIEKKIRQHHTICPISYFFCCRNNCVFTAQSTFPQLSHYECFQKELSEFILGNAGKQYQSPPPRWSKNWDRLIHDLTTVTARLTSTYIKKATFDISSKRGQYLFFLSGNFSDPLSTLHSFSSAKYNDFSLDVPPEVPVSENEQNDSHNQGFSIIEFVVSTDKERDQNDF